MAPATRTLGLVAALVTALHGAADAQPIDDPENPSSPSRSAPSAGVIADPENPGSIVDPENPGAGMISDPENPSATASTPQPASSALPARGMTGAPRAIFSGTIRSTNALDTRRDNRYEDTVELFQELEMRVRYRLTDRWAAVLEGRLGWMITGSGDADQPPWMIDTDTVRGRIMPELRDFYAAGRAGRWLLRVGQQSIVWGSSDIVKPSDVINPTDLRRGMFADPASSRIPIPAVSATHVWDRASWEFVLVPFFVPHRVTVYGGDTSPVRPSSLEIPALAGGSPITLIDASLHDLAQPLLLQTELPEETPRNMSFGSRLTFMSGGVDASLGWFFGWDRVPTVSIGPGGRALIEFISSGGFDDIPAPNPDAPPDVEDLAPLVELLGELAGRGSLYSATYERRHVVQLDAVRYFGPIGVRLDSAFSPRRTVALANLLTVRRPSLLSSLGLSYESSDGDAFVSTEAFHLHVFRERGDGPYLYGIDNLFGLALVTRLKLSAFKLDDTSRWRRLGVQLAGFYLPEGRDLIVSPTVTWDARPNLTLSLGGAFFASFGDKPSIGELLRGNDAVYVRLARQF